MSDLRAQTLGYVAGFTRIAQKLLRTGSLELEELAELTRCLIHVEQAIRLGDAPRDALPLDYVQRVQAAIAKAPIGEPVKATGSVSQWN